MKPVISEQNCVKDGRSEVVISEQVKPQDLEKSNRILQRKVERLIADQRKLELINEKKEALLRRALEESKAAETALEQALTELHNAQLQMVQAEKMSSLGQLVAGIAHEINNPVNFIHGNLDYVQQYAHSLLSFVQLYQERYPHSVAEIQAEAEALDLDFIQEDLPKTLHSMRMGTDRIRELVLSFRNFSRLDEAGFKAVDLHEGIDSTLLILQHRLKATPERSEIRVKKEYGKLPLVECYAGQLNQVFMNILANAIDALEEQTVKQTRQEGQADFSQILIRTSSIEQRWVRVAISDTGAGIPEAIQRRIFEPFFTTKPVGKGTGLGMSISYQIVTEKHGGTLECCSMLGQGAEFRIQIPICQRNEVAVRQSQTQRI